MRNLSKTTKHCVSAAAYGLQGLGLQVTRLMKTPATEASWVVGFSIDRMAEVRG